MSGGIRNIGALRALSGGLPGGCYRVEVDSEIVLPFHRDNDLDTLTANEITDSGEFFESDRRKCGRVFPVPRHRLAAAWKRRDTLVLTVGIQHRRLAAFIHQLEGTHSGRVRHGNHQTDLVSGIGIGVLATVFDDQGEGARRHHMPALSRTCIFRIQPKGRPGRCDRRNEQNAHCHDSQTSNPASGTSAT